MRQEVSSKYVQFDIAGELGDACAFYLSSKQQAAGNRQQAAGSEQRAASTGGRSGQRGADTSKW